jgi:hypothetical protein
VYATVTWGFTADEHLLVTSLPFEVTNKQSAEGTRAVALWNEQATGPKSRRNAPRQRTLPTLR